MIYFGMRLKALREEKLLTQEALSEIIGLKRATISQYERGGNFPSVERLIKIARFFGVSADYLLGLSDSDRFDLSGLSDEQAVAILEIIRQFEALNAQQKNLH